MFGLMPYESGKFDVFGALSDLEREIWGQGRSVPSFRTDIRDDGNAFVMEAEMPGYKKEDINIDVKGGYLTISASHSNEKEDKDKDGKYIRRERSFGSFSRSFDISNVNKDEIDAEYKDGVLYLNLPKKTKEPPASRRLEIR